MQSQTRFEVPKTVSLPHRRSSWCVEKGREKERGEAAYSVRKRRKGSEEVPKRRFRERKVREWEEMKREDRSGTRD